MTEKRFTVDDGLEDVLCWEINDKENEDMTCGECAKLLNELHEENEQLKQELCQQEMEYATEHHYLAEEKEQLKQTSQDYEDIVNNWFIDNWDKLSDEMKQSAHLEVGIDIEYGGDYE